MVGREVNIYTQVKVQLVLSYSPFEYCYMVCEPVQKNEETALIDTIYETYESHVIGEVGMDLH